MRRDVNVVLVVLSCGMAGGCASTHSSSTDGMWSDAGPMTCIWAPNPGMGFGACDARGLRLCDDWASSISPAAVARCVGYGDAPRCAMADRCPAVDAAHCTCGAGPECADGSACMEIAGERRCVVCETSSDS
jgi:hypothetical protein